MTTRRQHWLWQAPLASALLAGSMAAWAQRFPERPITLIVPYAAGGPTDQHLRAIAEEAGKALGQAIVIDNRPGANGTNAAAAMPRTAMEEAASAARIELNMVPYKGDADLATALLGGHLDAAPLSGVAVPHIEAGKMRYLVMLTDKRVKRYPDLPTLKESGVNAMIDSPYGLAGPKGMDPAHVKILHDAFRKALESPASVKVMDQLNQQINYKGSDEYRQYALQTLAREKDRVARLRQQGLVN